MDQQETIKVLMLGPALDVRGGISSVERLMLDHATPSVSFVHQPTYRDGNLLQQASLYMKAWHRTPSAMARLRPDILHIHFSKRGSTLRKLLLACRLRGRASVLLLHAHGSEFDLFYEKQSERIKKMIGNGLRRADCLITLSDAWRRYYLDTFDLEPERVVVLRNAVACDRPVPDRSGHERITLVFLGRIGKRKGAFDLLHAFADATKQMPALRLVLAGDGEHEAARGTIDSLSLGDRVRLLGWQDRASCQSLLEEGDLYVMPSYHEGLPMAILEAMSAGLPVITTPVGGIPEVVRHDREGSLVEPGDRSALSAAILKLSNNPVKRLEMGKAARQMAENESAPRYMQRMEQLYRDLLKQSSDNRS